ncbi:MAG: 16S rRNA (cytosine(1402)-N(4))-methyltransferase RsmH [Bacteroidota bacterium]
MSAALFHTPVLLHETLSYLAPLSGKTMVDATLGGGGHAQAILERIGDNGRCFGIDADTDALTAASERLKQFGSRFVPIHDNFGNLRAVLSQLSTDAVDGVLFDLGVSSHQLDEPSRGFTFRANDILDMRMDRRQDLHAAQVVNTYGLKELEEVFRMYGEEKHARRIASRIVERRQRSAIETTGDLTSIVESVVGVRFAVKSLARVFQALRIEVNGELDRLRQGLHQALDAVRNGGRIVVISYHSLEDRIVKDCFRDAARSVVPSGLKPVPDTIIQPRVRILTKKPVEASAAEIRMNPRARSAKLRAVEKI